MTVLALLLIAAGLVGAYLNITASCAPGDFVGTRNEFEFVSGTFAALICLPTGFVLLTINL